MKRLIIANLFALLFTASSSAQEFGTKNFELEYQTLNAKALCWQTCRDDRCEEEEYEIFWDVKTFLAINDAEKKGFIVSIEADKNCEDESIPIVDDHMPRLQKSSPAAAAILLAEKGVKVKLVIHSNPKEVVSPFIESLLED